MKKIIIAIASIAVLLSSCCKEKQAKYVFYFIGDGLGINGVYGADYYYRTVHGDSTVFTNISDLPQHGFLTSYSASSLVTCSAAAGTALATGHKTNAGAIGVDTEGNALSSIAQWAKTAGYGVGVITNVGVNHATPACFYAQRKSRSDYDGLLQDLVSSTHVDFLAGSGFILKRSGYDKAYWSSELEKAGWILGNDPERAAAVRGSKTMLYYGDNIPDSMPYAIDREAGDVGLVDYFKAATTYLEGNFDKFFLMCEAGTIDYANHIDDAATAIAEIHDLALCVGIAKECMQRHPDETLIVITSDHETGGFHFGYKGYHYTPNKLAGQKHSEQWLTSRVNELRSQGAGFGEVLSAIEDNFGIAFPMEEVDQLKAIYVKGGSVQTLYASNSEVVAASTTWFDHQCGLSWAYTDHTGAPVPLFATGVGAEVICQCRDNTDLPLAIAGVMGIKQN